MIDAYVKHNFGKVKLIAGVNYQNNQITTFSIPFGGTELRNRIYSRSKNDHHRSLRQHRLYLRKGFNLNTYPV